MTARQSSSVIDHSGPATHGHRDARAFDLGAVPAYRAWREGKLARQPESIEALRVEVGDLARPSAEECAALTAHLRQHNLVLYRSAAGGVDRATVRTFGLALGLSRLDSNLCSEEDGVSELQVSAGGRQADYIPYTNRPLSWHCDGYYNPPERRIRAMLLHCVTDAAEGGENALLDHELLYIRLRDENPGWIEALMHPQAMTIPENVENGVVLREAQSGPVFSVDPETGRLHLRYTARERNVHWRDDPLTREAAARIRELLASDMPGIIRHRLSPGEGILCNNVLHNRTGFRDDPQAGQTRLIYRARYLDRVAGT
ncbi:taurine catabolism dioxygenase [Thioalkalivibrio sulfidiphilus HL-EbGr7]|uniref:Taurine catabolism dioxygenase n=1 Tax=Thioalkalivibrio sulfidiphilus (strain HL-EbGR7) TaxID=396588 RepID=B8GUE4_THISH|nr:TauD/TfdA family dioxygenase [Thioalkalivibrio sulfidiphilus]ACL73264.1 taurine catabolism dioxygenase [Thioalkalivibrio sulfidiphilus HL-EbGr7]